MKKILIMALVFAAVSKTSGQTADDPRYLLTNKANSFEVTLPVMTDPYLSPMRYAGFGAGFENESRRFVSAKNIKWSQQQKFGLATGMMINPAQTSEMTFMGVNYGWGMSYHFRLAQELKVMAGGIWDAGFGFKSISRNVNNPVNMDMATNVNLTGLLMYDYPTRKRTLRFRVAVQTPLLGYMFVPQAGASYYDMFQLGDLKEAFHFSSLHNKVGLDQTYSVDVPFKRTTWRFGLKMKNLKYTANNLVFVRNEMSVMVGTTFDAISFGGRKKTPPSNFISTND